MRLLSFGSGSVWPSGDFDDATVSLRLWGGGIIYPKQSTQSGGGLWRGTSLRWDMCSSHHRCWADRKNRDIWESTREAAHHRVKKSEHIPWSKLHITVPWDTPLSYNSRLHSKLNSASSRLSKDRRHSSILDEYTKYTHYKQQSKTITM